MRHALIAIALLASFAAGCRGRSPQAMADRYTRNLLVLASRDSGCAPAQLQIQQIHPEVYSVAGCTIPYEYWLRCNARNRCAWERVMTVNEAASTVMSCPLNMVQQSPTADPTTRYATGCGRSAVFGIQCAAVGMGCGWVSRGAAPSGPVIVEQGTIPNAQRDPQVLVVPQPPPATLDVQIQAPAASVQAQVMAQREALLSCVDGSSMSLTLRWTPQGQVQLQAPPQIAGTAAEGCMQAVVGTLHVQAAGAGQTIVALQ
jgi:hypothetical protein